MNSIKHVAIIMDGNGRWGIKHKKSDGIYLSGLFLAALSPSKLKEAIKSCLESGADGVCLFNNEYLTEKHIKIIKSYR